MEAQKEGKVGGLGCVTEGALRPAHAAHRAKKWRNKEKAMERKERNGKREGKRSQWDLECYRLCSIHDTHYGIQYLPRFTQK